MRAPGRRVRVWLAIVALTAAVVALLAVSFERRHGLTRRTLAVPHAGDRQILTSASGASRTLVTTNAPAGQAALGSSLDRLEERQMHSLSDDDWRRLVAASSSRKTAELKNRVRASSGPLISRIETDEREICAGGTLLVRTSVFHPETRIWVNGTQANPATVQLHQPGQRFVYVRAEGGARPEDADVERVSVEVKDCGSDRSLMISATRSMVHEPTAIIRVMPPPVAESEHGTDALSGYSFLYDFGDGVVEQSNLPVIQHTYAPSAETRPVHYIKVTATDVRGQEMSGRTLYSYRRTKETPAAPPEAPEWMKPKGDPVLEARRARDLAEQRKAMPEAYTMGRTKPPEGPLGDPNVWAPELPDTSDDGVRPE